MKKMFIFFSLFAIFIKSAKIATTISGSNAAVQIIKQKLNNNKIEKISTLIKKMQSDKNLKKTLNLRWKIKKVMSKSKQLAQFLGKNGVKVYPVFLKD